MKFCTLLSFLLALGGGAVHGNHIVGGELELVHVEGFRYSLNLIQYFDKAQTANLEPDRFLIAYIFRKSDDKYLRRDTLFLKGEEAVPYTNPECTLDELKMDRIFYSKELELLPEDFNDPGGYYVVWERCCRNEGTVNIVNPNGTGQTYYLEFPAVVRDGKPFVNSSPSLFPPLSDYACVNQLYYADFAGVDLDGDSLVYSLVSPLNSSATVPLPLPQPVPHPEVIWMPGISLENVIPGNPALRISPRGFLTVKPEMVGLFVFSVLCQEFRKGEKIGEVRRDFQMLVVGGCTPPPPPVLEARVPGSLSFNSVISDTLRFTAGDNKCFDIQVTDPVGEKKIKLRAVGANFDGEVDGIFSITEGYLSSPDDLLNIQICLSSCPYVSEGPYLIDLIAADDACPLPQMDTLRLAVIVQPPPNTPPTFVNTNRTVIETIDEGMRYLLTLEGIDADDDRLMAKIEASDFVPDEWGMVLDTVRDELGELEVVFEWDTGCSSFPFGTKNNFEFTINLYDHDLCEDDATDVVHMNLRVNLPFNNAPILTTTLSSNEIYVPVGSILSFPLTATDADGDFLRLDAVPINFDFADYFIDFTPAYGQGRVDAAFAWQLGCDQVDIEIQDYFEINFIASDEDFCLQSETDIITLKINVYPEFNAAPEITVTGLLENRVTVNSLESIELEVTAVDPDNDFLWLDLLEGVPLPPSETFEFERVESQGSVAGVLRWAPECGLFSGQKEVSYKVSFLAWDTRCPNPEFDTLSVFIDLVDRESPDQFLPANVFTPNGDGINDTFSIADLPVDNCDDQFEVFRVVTREGTEVFASRERDFTWAGSELPSGTYYYMVKFRRRSFNGVLSILR